MGKSDVKRHLEDVRIAGRIILKWILKSWDCGTFPHGVYRYNLILAVCGRYSYHWAADGLSFKPAVCVEGVFCEG